MGPPLFLGYLKGVPFFWVLKKCWRAVDDVDVSLARHFLFCRSARRARADILRLDFQIRLADSPAGSLSCLPVTLPALDAGVWTL